ncbi:DUF1071 domain-containing protein [Oenococcus sicerae]|uniref:DUF1071 domain-containing protein n=1 Tax=Oenococcus sicerae TaxID=2203724 RepID=A0ABX5QPZ5_9LACO|nr:DUF1071 domain-containing protein [Oenococcus sicerae]QAS70650.1 DUF1071 domain-containing protein [Oenococcus sicerae]
MTDKSIFKQLSEIDVNGRVEKKDTGKVTLSYLSWTWAWSELQKYFPSATYTIEKFENKLPYVYDNKTGYMVFTSITINDLTHEMWLPVMDGNNRAMLDHEYQIKFKSGKSITVASATMFDINKAIMRCLVKNIAMFGLGIYIYAGEDLPTIEPELATENQLDTIGRLLKEVSELSATNEEVIKQFVFKRLAIKDLSQIDSNNFGSALEMINELKKKAQEKKGDKK